MNISSFLRRANENQIKSMFFIIHNIVREELKENKDIYLNTHGTGVPWMHFRIDNEPKYYSFDRYRY